MAALPKKFTSYKIYLLLLCLVVLTINTSSSVLAAVGINRQINFQGKLITSSGINVTDGSYSVVFSLYNVSSSGTALWTETQSVSVTDGVFRVSLGAVTPFPANFNFNWDGLYLGVKVGADSEMTPRIRMTAVPFAFNAEKVAGLTVQDDSGNASTSATLRLANNKTVTISNSLQFTGTDSTSFAFPSSSGTVVTEAFAQTLTNKTIGSTGLTFSGATTDITTGTNEHFAIMPNGSGNVGVGTVSPLAKLDVNGNLHVAGAATASAVAVGYTGIGAGTNNVVISGNVGIGTSTPGTNMLTLASGKSLELDGITSNNAVLYATSGTGVVTAATTSTSSLCLVSGASAPSWTSCSAAASNYWQLNTGTLSPFSNTLDLLVGGTATSSAKFAVLNMNSGTPTASVSSGTTALVLAGDGSIQSVRQNNLTLGGNTTGHIIFAPGGSTALTMTSAGNVGIGTTTPTQKLDISGAVNSSTGFYYGGSGSPLSVELTRTIPTTVDDYVEIGTFTLSSGAHNFRVSITNSDSGFSVAKTYLIPVQYNGTANTWRTVSAIADTGAYQGTQDYALDINVNTNVASLRIRRTLGSTAGTARVRVESVGQTNDVFAASSATGSTTAPTAYYGNIYQSIVSGNVGIGTIGPDAKLDVAATTEQLRLSYTDGSVFSSSTVDSSGNLTINNTGTKTVIADDLQVTGNDILDSGAATRLTLGATTTLTNTTTTLSGTTTLTASSLTTFTVGALSLNATGALTLDSTTDITLDADGADIFFNDAGTTFATFTNSSTDLILDVAGGDFRLADTDTFVIGGITTAAYNAISDSGGATSHSLASDDDLFVEGDVEVNGTLWADGALTAASTFTLSALTGNQNSVLYAGASSAVSSANTTTSGLCLVSGATTPTWTSCASAASNYWQLNGGALSPFSSGLDVLVGANATSSALIRLGGTSGANSFFNTGGNVGIGTTLPTAKLDVAGDASTSGVLSFRGTTDPKINALNGEHLSFQTSAGGDAGLTARMTIQNDGNIGIGTTTPQQKLTLTSGTIVSVAGGASYTLNSVTNGNQIFTSANSVSLIAANTGITIPTLAAHGSVGVVGASGQSTGGRTNIGVFGYSGMMQTLSGNSGNNSTGGYFLADLTSAVTDFNGTLYGVRGRADSSTGDQTGGSVFGGHFTGVGEANNTVYGGYFTASGGTTNYGIYSAAGVNYFNGNVGIGTTAPLAKLDVNGNLHVSGTATSSALAVGYTGIGAGTGNAIFSGNIGIGTSTATSYRLDVSGTLRVTGATTFNGIAYTWPGADGSSGYALTTNGSGTLSWQAASGLGTNYWDQTSGAIYPKISTTDFFIGGTSTSSAKFAVLNVNTGTVNASVSAGTTSLVLYGDGSIQSVRRNTLTLGGSTTGHIAFAPTGTTAMTVTSGGNVGIGITNPQRKLAIADSGSGSVEAIFQNSTTGYTAADGFYFGIDANEVPSFWNYENTDITFGTNGTEKIRLLANGNLGVGTTAPEALLEVQGIEATDAVLALDADDGDDVADTWFIKSLASNNSLSFLNNTTEVASLTLAGALQIDSSLDVDGTTSDIAGTLNLSGNTLTSTGDLSIDAGGGDVLIADGDRLIIGGLTTAAYNAISDSGVTSHSLASDDDLFVEGDFEVNGSMWADGAFTAASTFTLSALTGNQNSVLYAGASSAVTSANTTTSGLCLVSGATTPTWTSCASAASNYWQLNGGALSPFSSGLDVLVGANATSSALIRLGGTSGQASFFNGGNVGIGITNPTDNLHIETAASVGLKLKSSGASSDFTLSRGANTDFLRILFQTAGSTFWTMGNRQEGDSSFNIYNGGNAKTFSIQGSAPADSFYIATSGNTGIGTANPRARLDVNGNLSVAGTATSSALAVGYTGIGAGTGNAIISGNVGIGTTAPGASLSFGPNANAQQILLYESGNTRYGIGVPSNEVRLFTASNATKGITFGTMSTSDGSTYSELVRIATSGNVGIGTTAPGEALEVNGNIKTTNNRSLPNLVIDSSSSSTSWGDQGAYIALGETASSSGSAALYLSYRGDGFGFIGAGGLNENPSTGGVPNGGYWRFDYDTSNVYTESDVETDGNLNVDGTSNDIAGTLNLSGSVLTSTGTLSLVNASTGLSITADGVISDLDDATVTITDGLSLTFLTGDQNSVLYAGASDVIASVNTTTSGLCLVSNANTPSWQSCASAASNYWQVNSGALSPFSNTLDVLVGSTATSSAKVRLGGTTNSDSFFNSGGNVGIGSTAPEALLEIQGVEATDAVLALDADDGDDAEDTWFIKSAASGNFLQFTNGTTDVGRLSSAGALQISSNLDVDGTSSDIAGTLNLSGNTLTSTGDLTINAGGGDIIFADTDTFAIGGIAAGTAYNAISDSGGATSHSLASDDDLFVEGDFEVNGTLWADGALTATGNVDANSGLDVAGADITAATGVQVDFADEVADKLLLYSTSYGIGVSSSETNWWSAGTWSWRQSSRTGTEVMQLTNAGNLDIAGTLTAGTTNAFSVAASGAISTVTDESINGIDISAGAVSDVVSLTFTTGGNNWTAGVITASSNIDINGTANDIAGTLNLSGNTLTSTGDLTINAGGGDILFADGDTFAIGGVAAGLAYNAISDSGGATTHSLASDDDLYVQGEFEVNGTLWADGALTVAGLITGDDVTLSGDLTLSTLTGNQNSVLYAGASDVIASANTTTSGLCLVSNATQPSWQSCASAASNYWQLNSGALSPGNSTYDVLVGSSATSSAKVKLGGTTNAISFFNTGGNVGIGTTLPGNLFELQMPTGASSAEGFAIAGRGGGAFSITNGTGTANVWAPVIAGKSSYHSGAGLLIQGETAFDQATLSAILIRAKDPGADAAVSSTNVLQINNWTTNIMTISAGGNVGIGTTAPAHKLHLVGTLTNDDANGIYSDITATATTTNDHFMKGIHSSIWSNISAGITNTGYQIGVLAASMHDSQGDLDDLRGLWVQYGNYNTGATGDTTNAYGVKIDPYMRAGTITNSYGLYIDTNVAGGTVTNQWSIYSANTAASYFAGNLGIGTTAPEELLHLAVDGATSATAPTLRIENTHTSIDAAEEYGAIEFEANDISTNGTGISGFIRNVAINAGVTSALTFGTRDSGAADAVERMRLINTGNLGIGTTIPVYKLQLNDENIAVNPTEVVASINTDDTGYNTLLISNAGTDPSTTPRPAGIHFKSPTYGATGGYSSGRIISYFDTTGGSNPGYIGAVLALQHPTADNTFTTGLALRAGSVGIGTTVPLATLDVRAQSGTLPIGAFSGSTAFAGLVVQQGGNGDIFTASTSSTTRFVIKNDGNVGIGTTAPADPLNISGTALAARLRLTGVSSGGTEIPGITLYQDTTFKGALVYSESTNNVAIFSGSGGTSRLDVASNGFVGIGTTAPVGLFHVEGSTTLAQGAALVRINQTGAADIFTASTSGTTRFVINNAGNVGIGSTTPEALLEIQGIEATDAVLALDADDGDDTTDTWFIKSLASGNSLSFMNHTTEVMNLSSAGALQIDSNLDVDGTTNDIAGTLNLSGNTLTSTGDLTINAGGGDIIFADGDTFAIGGVAAGLAYNAISDSGGATSHGLASDDDLFVEGIIETNDDLYVDGEDLYVGTTRFSESISASYLRIDPQSDTIIQYDGSNSQKFRVYMDGSHYIGLTGSNTESSLTTSGTSNNLLIDASGGLITMGATDNIDLNGDLYIQNSSGNVGIGTTNPLAKLQVDGTGSSATEISLRSQAAGQYPFLSIGRTAEEGVLAIAASAGQFSDNSTTGDLILRNVTQDIIISARSATGRILFTNGSGDYETMRIDNNGNIGIGNGMALTASAQFQVTETNTDGVVATFGSSTGTNNPALYIVTNEASNYTQLFQSGSGYGDFRFATSNTDRMVIEAGGDIGIGTTNPETPLHVMNASMPLLVERTSTSVTNSRMFTNKLLATTTQNMADGFGPSLVFSIEDNAAVTQEIAQIAGIRNGADTSGALAFITYNAGTATENMRLNLDGNLGIGTTAPSVKLEVVDTANDLQMRIGTTGTAGLDPSIRWSGRNAANTVSAHVDLQLDADAGVFNIFAPNTTTPTVKAISVLTGGNVGIGTTAPSSKLEVAGGLTATPGTPTIVGSTATDSTNMDLANGVAVQGRYAYIASTTSDSLSIIDVSSPSAPVRISTIIDATNLNGARNVVVNGKYAYVTAEVGDRLTVVDVSNPASPYVIGNVTSATQLDSAFGLAVSGQYAYVTSRTDDRMTIVDISNPRSPTIVSSSTNADTETNDLWAIAVQGKYAYATARLGTDDLAASTRFVVFDISNPASIVKVASVTSSNLNDARALHVSGKYAYVTGLVSDSVVIFDISNPASPTEVGVVTNTVLDNAFSIQVSGKYAHIVTASDRYVIVDISNPASPSIISSVLSGTQLDAAANLVLAGRYAYVTSQNDDLMSIVDIGYELPVLQAGSIGTSQLFVQDDTNLGNNVYVGGDLLASGVHAASISATQANFNGHVRVGAGSLCVKSTNVACAGAVAGTIYATNTTVQGADVAELYPSDEALEPGDVVTTAIKERFIAKSNEAYDGTMLGIISTDPGITLGSDPVTPDAKHYPVALVGRVPVKIASDSGAIVPGDMLTSSTESGKAMKATQAGVVVGKALESWTPDSGKTTIMVFVKVGWYDPEVSLTTTGNLQFAKSEDGTFTVADVAGVAVSRISVFKEAAIANLRAGSIDAEEITIGGKKLTDLVAGSATQSADLSGITSDIATVKQDISSVKTDVLGLGAKMVSLEQKIDSTASDAAFIRTILESGVFTASSSGQFASGEDLDIQNAVITEDLMVLGRTTLSDLGVTGSITAGVIGIDGLTGEINTIGESLKIQSLATEAVDIMNGKVVISTDGKVTITGTVKAKTIEAEAVKVLGSETIGTGIIPAGATSIEVSTEAATTDVKVFVTATTVTDKALTITKKENGKFTVRIKSSDSSPITFDWWIVGN